MRKSMRQIRVAIGACHDQSRPAHRLPADALP